ncbi:hypothetical protein QR685DRAFT_447739 [Neurospora intermedia]|uniref:Uncharacterized protein n=1 Tax=Neurospora intermedia TaxID=5142 RepID=A0ABR3D5H6_NEUIN
MCGQIKTSYKCPDCSDVVSTSNKHLTCAKAKYWGSCGDVRADNKEVSKQSDKSCSSCKRKKEAEEKKEEEREGGSSQKIGRMP